MPYFFVLAIKEGQALPTVVWSGDNPKEQDKAYQDAKNDQKYHHHWLMMACRTFGRYCLPPN